MLFCQTTPSSHGVGAGTLKPTAKEEASGEGGRRVKRERDNTALLSSVLWKKLDGTIEELRNAFLLTDTESASTSILNFPTSKAERNKLCL